MKRIFALFFALCLALGMALAAFISCQDMEEADIPPPGTETDDDSGDGDTWSCDISPQGTVDLPYTPDCGTLPDWATEFSITGLRGTAAVMADGERYRLRGHYNFPDKPKGKLEPSIECPSGSNYEKCSYPFDESSGDFELRWQVENCPDLKHPTTITINLYDESTQLTVPFCNVYLGEPPADDDSASDDDDGWTCDIPNDGLSPVPYTITCTDPYINGNKITVASLNGTADTLEKGARFEIQGQLGLTTIKAGKVELTIGCPNGSTYRKCSWPFIEPSGDFTLRLEVTDCVPLNHPNEITLNIWNAADTETMAFCHLLLGETADDDSADDDATITPAGVAPKQH